MQDKSDMDTGSHRNQREWRSGQIAKSACSKLDRFKKYMRAYALCTTKEENLKEWKERWLAVGKGRYVWVNRWPPSQKPLLHLTNNPNCNTYGRLIQSQLGHAHIGGYYKDFNIPKDPLCPCSETYQTHIHVITVCL
jgi:hypothetical protein